MSAQTDTLAEQLERTALASDAIEAERLHRVVKARLLEQTVPETRIDRFVVVGPVGTGGMGIVYAAYDPELDRKVAIKLVRTWGDQRREQDQERLVREARALARLSHPHVVAVYEVGLHRDSVFIAMEFVRGKTLRAHVAGAIPWREAVRAYLQAAEGLAAAHEAGLVHRDFKPDNAILGDDGRVRVVDFGLARGEGAQDAGTAATSAPGTDTPLTITGALVGTPAYMAPEQRLGLPVGPKSDQFGFCAALHEALCGSPPKIHVDTVKLALPSNLPARLRRAVARGLSQSPDDRFADMRALIAELRATTETARRLGITAVVAVAVGIGAGATIPAMLGGDDPCPDPSGELGGAWDEPGRAALHDAAAELGEAAVASATIVERELDDRAATWIAARRDSCDALYVRKTDSEALFDKRMRCLDRGRAAMADLVGLLADGDAATWERAVEAVVGLPPLSTCDAETLTVAAALPTDPASVAEIDRLHAQIDRVQTLGRLGRFAAALPLAEETVKDAMLVGHRPTEAEALAALAMLYGEQERDAEAEPMFLDAAWRAEAGHADELAVDLLAKAIVVAAQRGRLEDAEALGLRLGGAIERFGRDSVAEIQVLAARYALAAASSRFEEAESLALARVEASIRLHGEQSLSVAGALNDLGLMQYERGDFAAARDSFTRVLAIRREWLGPGNPSVIMAFTNLASVDERQGREEEARATLESAIADAEHSLTPSPVLATALSNLANLHQQAGRNAEAVPLAERALAVLETTVGPQDLRLLTTLNVLGVAYDGLHRKAEARACYERVLALADSLDPDHPHKAYAWNNLAEMDRADGDFAAARDQAERALSLWSRTNGPEHPISGQLAYTLSLAELGLGELDDAADHARHAIRVLEKGGSVDAPSLAGARFVLARALWEGGEGPDRDAAVAAAIAAAEALEGTGNAADAVEIRSWLRKHGSE